MTAFLEILVQTKGTLEKRFENIFWCSFLLDANRGNLFRQAFIFPCVGSVSGDCMTALMFSTFIFTIRIWNISNSKMIENLLFNPQVKICTKSTAYWLSFKTFWPL